jgi:hypothetical protein
MPQVPSCKAEMADAPLESMASTRGPRPSDLRLRKMLVALMAVAILFGLATWGGWVKRDAVLYLSVAVVAVVFSSAARHTLLGVWAIFMSFCLGLILADIIFGRYPVANVNPRSVWLFTPLLLSSAAFLRGYTRATAWSLVISLVLIELFIVAVPIYGHGCSTLFQALAPEYREKVFKSLQDLFPIQRWYIVAPWLLGIVAGEVILRRRKPSSNVSQ